MAILPFDLSSSSLNVWAIWILPFIAALIIPGVAKISKRATGGVAVAFALASAISAATLLPLALNNQEIHNQVPWISSIGLKAGILADPLAILMANVVGWISFLIFVYSTGYMKGDKDITRFWVWMTFFVGSMQLIVLSDNFLQLFFGWEGVGLASYSLVGFWYRDKKKDHVGTEGRTVLGIMEYYSPTHSGIKAFIMTKVGDIMMLAGMFLIFAFAGTFGFRELTQHTEWATAMSAQHLLIPAAVLLFGGAIGKSAQFPLNEWLLEAMTGPTAVSALIHAATMVKAGVFLVARIGPLFFALGTMGAFSTEQFFEVVAWVGAITAFLLATQALVNPEIKKVLAYSTGSQIGYMMMGLGIAGLSLNFVDGYTSGFFHMMSHAMFKASLFMGAGALLHAVGSRFMTDMGGLKKPMRKTYIFMLLASLSLAGAPLFTSGFWSKDAIFAAVLESGYAYSWPLFIMAVVVAVMTAFYTFRMIGMAFFGKASKHIEEMEHSGHHVHEAGPSMLVPYAILAVASIAIGVVGFVFEAQIHALFTNYLAASFGIHGQVKETAGSLFSIAPVGDKTWFGLNPLAAAASVGAFAVGGALGFVFYIARKADPEVISRSIVTRAIWKFLYNRWYLNTALYWGSVIIPLAVYRIIWRYFESTIIDGMNPALQYSMSYMSRVVKSGQTGITQTYLFVFAVGIMIIVMLLFL